MKFSISRKIISIAVISVVVSSVMILFIGTFFTSRQLELAARNEMSTMNALVARIQNQEEERLRQSSQIIASMPQFVDAVHNQDTQAIKEIAEMTLLHFNLDVVTVTDANGIVLARGHSDSSGDDISGRATTTAALRGEHTAGILFDETAYMPFSIRSDAPVFWDGIVVGSISLAYNIASEAYIDSFQEITGMHFTILHGNVRLMTSIRDIDGNRIIGTTLDDAQILDIVLVRGETTISQVEIINEPYMGTFWPIKYFD
jgi:methyl-accepting chemotaxis protein